MNSADVSAAVADAEMLARLMGPLPDNVEGFVGLRSVIGCRRAVGKIQRSHP